MPGLLSASLADPTDRKSWLCAVRNVSPWSCVEAPVSQSARRTSLELGNEASPRSARLETCPPLTAGLTPGGRRCPCRSWCSALPAADGLSLSPSRIRCPSSERREARTCRPTTGQRSQDPLQQQVSRVWAPVLPLAAATLVRLLCLLSGRFPAGAIQGCS